MELTIDALPCDLGTSPIAVPAYETAALADPQMCREGRSLRITLPATDRNAAVVGFAGDPHNAESFDARQHRAELTAEGAVLFSGTVHLLSSGSEGYVLELRDGGAEWAENAALRMFNALGIDYSVSLIPTTISESWTGQTPVRFFPIHRDEYPQANSPTDLLPAERLLSVGDYHPFLHVATLVERIFDEAGYRIRSRFFESEFFRSLYMSGAYASRNTSAAIARMGFRAGRLQTATASANHAGRVFADPAAIYNSLGNIVETATPRSTDADDGIVAGLYNNGNCFTRENGRIVFRPSVEVSAGFEYCLRYTTDHRILSRSRLCGFDTFYLGPGARIASALANRYEDRRQEIAPNHAYLAVVFDHVAGAQYRLTYTLDGSAGAVWSDFATRTARVQTPVSGSVADPVLLQRTGSGWTPCTGDWALYDGHIAERGQTTVEVRLRTAHEILSPTSPKYFDTIFFSGAEEGMNITLHKECSLEVRFASSPGFGSHLCYADVAQHRIRQIGLLEALAHLFNLRFYTERQTRTAWIEPQNDFFGGGPEIDWSDRTDFSQPVVREPIAPGIFRRRTWGYQPGDGAVARSETLSGTEFGRWTCRTDSFAARQGDEVRLNPLFAPSLSSEGHYLNAPSARLLQVGDRDDTEQDGTNFTPRIVRYAGLHPLPAGERWGYPSNRDEYPLAAFHFAGDAVTEGFTLCFEDRDGVQGLHRFYDTQTAREASRERITLNVRIAPHEYAVLFNPGTGAADIRSAFRIDTGAGIVRATLHAIAPYDPEAASVRVTFTRQLQD